MVRPISCLLVAVKRTTESLAAGIGGEIFTAATGAHFATAFVAHAGQPMFGFTTPLFTVVDNKGSTDHEAEGDKQQDEVCCHFFLFYPGYPPKSSKWMFSGSTPRSSSMAVMEAFMTGGPQM